SSAVTDGLPPPPNSAFTAREAGVMSSHWTSNGGDQSVIAAEKSTFEPAAEVANDASTVVLKPLPRSTCAAVEKVAFTLPPAYENPSFVAFVKETQLGSTVPPVAAGRVALSERPVKFAVESSTELRSAEPPSEPASSTDPVDQPNACRTDAGRSATSNFVRRSSPPLNWTVSGTVS